MDIWVPSSFWPLWIMVQQALAYEYQLESLFSVLTGIYLGVEFLSYRVILHSDFWETVKLFSTTPVSFYISTSNIWGFHLLCVHLCLLLYLFSILKICFLLQFFLVGVKWYCFVVVFCISLMTTDVELVFMCLLTICVSSLEKYLWKSFVRVWIVLFFLFLSCRNSLYIVNDNPFSDTWSQIIAIHHM